jgi:hypothetical protein
MTWTTLEELQECFSFVFESFLQNLHKYFSISSECRAFQKKMLSCLNHFIRATPTIHEVIRPVTMPTFDFEKR